jgi:formate/nitrite transporter
MPPAELYATIVISYAKKCRFSNVTTMFGGVVGGALIGLAGLFYVIVMTDNNLTGGIAKLVGGVSFSLGLVMISITGAELFTGNILALLGRGYRLISTRQILRNWGIVYVSNFLGALAIGLSAASAGMLSGAAAPVLAAVTEAKLSQSVLSMFLEGVLCNILVCLAIWMGLSTRHPSGRILCIAGPITAFVAMGLEHSIANMFFFSASVFAEGTADVPQMLVSMNIVTAGNIVGAGLLCLFMAFAFCRNPEARSLLKPLISAAAKFR